MGTSGRNAAKVKNGNSTRTSREPFWHHTDEGVGEVIRLVAPDRHRHRIDNKKKCEICLETRNNPPKVQLTP